MLVTDNAELARKYSYYGSGPGKTNFVNLGRHMMMPEISAILGIHQFKRIEEFITKRNEIADIYNKAFDEMIGVYRIKCPAGSRSSYYKYPLTLSSKVDKTKFVKSLENFEIETGNVFYPPCHQQAVYKLQGEEGLALPVSEKVLAQTVTMPMHVELSNADVLQVVESVSLALNAQQTS